MAEYVKKLHVKKNGTTEDISLYSTETEAGQSHISVNFYADSAYYLSTGYAKIGNPGDAAASKLRVSSNSLGQNRAVLKRAADMCEITLRCYDVETENQISSVKYSAEKNNYLYLNNINAPQIAEYDFVMMDGVKNLVTSNNNIFNVWYIRKTVPDRMIEMWKASDIPALNQNNELCINTYSAIDMYENYDGIFPQSVVKILRFNTSNIKNFCKMFYNLKNLISVPQLDTSNGTDFSYMYSFTKITGIPWIDVSNATTMESMFQSCTNLNSVPVMNTSKVTNMRYLYRGCEGLISVPQLDTSNATDVSFMYSSCRNLQEIPPMDTSKVTSAFSFFSYCKKITTIPQIDISQVRDGEYMFKGCSSLVSIPKLNTSKIESFQGMFSDCTSLRSIPWEIDMSSCKPDIISPNGYEWENTYACKDMFTNCPVTGVRLKNVPRSIEPYLSSIGTPNYTVVNWLEGK